MQRLSVEVAILCEEERSLPLGSQSTLLTAAREGGGGRERPPTLVEFVPAQEHVYSHSEVEVAIFGGQVSVGCRKLSKWICIESRTEKLIGYQQN